MNTIIVMKLMKNGMICLFLHNYKTKVLTLVLIFWFFSFGCANAAISGTAYLKVHVDSKGNAQSVKLVRGIVKELDVIISKYSEKCAAIEEDFDRYYVRGE